MRAAKATFRARATVKGKLISKSVHTRLAQRGAPYGTSDVGRHPRLEETSPGPSAPSARWPRQNTRRCWPRCGARDAATCSPATSYGCVRPDVTRPILPGSYAARAPGYTARCAPISRALWAWSTMSMADSSHPSGRPCCSRRCGGRCWPCSRRPPRACGWGRTRWSCATLALTLPSKRGLTVSAETRRRWLDERGWVWKRPTLVATDHDPHRIARLARIRYRFEQRTRCEAMVVADERAIHL
jgi:hypothetical protein